MAVDTDKFTGGMGGGQHKRGRAPAMLLDRIIKQTREPAVSWMKRPDHRRHRVNLTLPLVRDRQMFDLLTVDAVDLPLAAVPPGALTEPPEEGHARQRIGRGEVVVTDDVVAATGLARRADPGTVVVGVGGDVVVDDDVIGLDVTPDESPLRSGTVKYGEVPEGAFQAQPVESEPAALVPGERYYIYASADIMLPNTRCIFTY